MRSSSNSPLGFGVMCSTSTAYDLGDLVDRGLVVSSDVQDCVLPDGKFRGRCEKVGPIVGGGGRCQAYISLITGGSGNGGHVQSVYVSKVIPPNDPRGADRTAQYGSMPGIGPLTAPFSSPFCRIWDTATVEERAANVRSGAAWHCPIYRHDTEMRRCYHRLCKRGKLGNASAVAIMHKLLLHRTAVAYRGLSVYHRLDIHRSYRLQNALTLNTDTCGANTATAIVNRVDLDQSVQLISSMLCALVKHPRPISTSGG